MNKNEYASSPSSRQVGLVVEHMIRQDSQKRRTRSGDSKKQRHIETYLLKKNKNDEESFDNSILSIISESCLRKQKEEAQQQQQQQQAQPEKKETSVLNILAELSTLKRQKEEGEHHNDNNSTMEHLKKSLHKHRRQHSKLELLSPTSHPSAQQEELPPPPTFDEEKSAMEIIPRVFLFPTMEEDDDETEGASRLPSPRKRQFSINDDTTKPQPLPIHEQETPPPPVQQQQPPPLPQPSRESQASWPQHTARAVARRPRLVLGCAFLISTLVAVLGMTVGNHFQVAADNAGWASRGTDIANRQAQYIVVQQNQDALWRDTTGEVWRDLIQHVQPGWETEQNYIGRRRHMKETTEDHRVGSTDSASSRWHDEFQRRLQTTNALDNCDASWYSRRMVVHRHLWPVWKVKNVSKPNILLRDDVLQDLCLAEEATQRVLIEKNLCFGCSDGGCLPPYSAVLFARMSIFNGFDLDCYELAEQWAQTVEQDSQFETELNECTEYVEGLTDPSDLLVSNNFFCPSMFTPILYDDDYAETGVTRYTSSIFATKLADAAIQSLYDSVDEFSRGSKLIEGVYDTQYNDFGEIHLDKAVGTDMIMAMGSAVITLMAILIHTRSMFLSIVGLFQIMLSFPLAFVVYTFVCKLEFFPFLNFLAVFVVFALGADDIFVAVDKWKNARIDIGNEATVEEIAVVALPDAAQAMFLTTITTAVAFFGTAICPVAPIRCFAVFVGLMIVFDYIMCILLVFPALCIYDENRPKNNFCCHFRRCEKERKAEDNDSLIRRILESFYISLHEWRYFLAIACAASLAIAITFASKLELPTSSEVRVLPSDNEFEMNFEWRNKLEYEVLKKKSGSRGYVFWGVQPADTGDHNNPKSFTQLVLDESFEPSKPEAQLYMRDFCENFFENEWASPYGDTECSMNKFDKWLQYQSNLTLPDDIYYLYCGDATGLPVAEQYFDSCIYSWSQRVQDKYVLSWNGKVKVVYFPYSGQALYGSAFSELEQEWHATERWMSSQRDTIAPVSANRMFFTSPEFWWYDTNRSMVGAAYVAAGISIATGAVVILTSSRSLVLTLFSAVTIGFVLTSVTACLYALGWTLGFLEAICFAILIGISADFVIHFSHAYASPAGVMTRHERTKHALIRMGPSILAAAFTTIASATIMLFTVITFFAKFAVILFFTILQATIGSFVFFVILADTFGPTNPTYTVDLVSQWISNLFRPNDPRDTDVNNPEKLPDECESTGSLDIDIEGELADIGDIEKVHTIDDDYLVFDTNVVYSNKSSCE